MKSTKIIIILFILFNISLSAKNNNLIVNIENFSSNKGNVRVHLYDIINKKYFPTNSDKIFALEVATINNLKAKVIFKDIPNGIYSITVHHDENLNVKMDRNLLGIPIEGWGVSNNIKHNFSAPDFEECSFRFDDNTMEIKIVMNN